MKQMVIRFLTYGLFTSILGVGFADIPKGADFVISAKKEHKKKKLSIDALKEHIGTMAKDAFDQSIIVVSRLGDCQMVFAAIQEQGLDSPAGRSDPSIRPVFAKASTGTQDERGVVQRENLRSSVSMHKTLGGLGQKIALIQATFSQALEKLINGQKPFKKASRADLEHALSTVTQANNDMTTVAGQLQTVHDNLEKEQANTGSLHTASTTLEQQKNLVTAIERRLSTDICLKRS